MAASAAPFPASNMQPFTLDLCFPETSIGLALALGGQVAMSEEERPRNACTLGECWRRSLRGIRVVVLVLVASTVVDKLLPSKKLQLRGASPPTVHEAQVVRRIYEHLRGIPLVPSVQFSRGIVPWEEMVVVVPAFTVGEDTDKQADARTYSICRGVEGMW